VTPAPLVPTLKEEIPQVELAVRFVPPYENSNNVLIVNEGERFFEKKIFFTDPEVFEMFKIPFVKGNSFQALTEAGTVVITESTAAKYFGEENPLGKVIQMEFDYDMGDDAVRLQDFKIIGVIEDAPTNTHIKYNMLVSMETFKNNRVGFSEDWVNYKLKISYVKLAEDSDPILFEEQIQRYAQIVENQFMARYNRSIGETSFHIQPITQIHMHTLKMTELEPGGNRFYIYIQFDCRISPAHRLYEFY